jgi:hypothetical protein
MLGFHIYLQTYFIPVQTYLQTYPFPLTNLPNFLFFEMVEKLFIQNLLTRFTFTIEC